MLYMIAVRKKEKKKNIREALFGIEGESKPEGLRRGVVSSVTAACMS